MLKSSNELVEALKAEMRDCVGRVTRGAALLDLAGVFQVGGARVHTGSGAKVQFDAAAACTAALARCCV